MIANIAHVKQDVAGKLLLDSQRVSRRIRNSPVAGNTGDVGRIPEHCTGRGVGEADSLEGIVQDVIGVLVDGRLHYSQWHLVVEETKPTTQGRFAVSIDVQGEAEARRERQERLFGNGPTVRRTGAAYDDSIIRIGAVVGIWRYSTEAGSGET